MRLINGHVPANLFERLICNLDGFTLDTAFTREYDLEKQLSKYLTLCQVYHRTQRTDNDRRYDVICRSASECVCIELKVRCDTKDMRQFDRYLPKFPDGMIVLCWSASPPAREIFRSVEKLSPVPVHLVEMSAGHSMI